MVMMWKLERATRNEERPPNLAVSSQPTRCALRPFLCIRIFVLCSTPVQAANTAKKSEIRKKNGEVTLRLLNSVCEKPKFTTIKILGGGGGGGGRQGGRGGGGGREGGRGGGGGGRCSDIYRV